jgi:hypothetical protein
MWTASDVGHRPVPEQVEPLPLRRVDKARAELVDECPCDVDHVGARVAARRHDDRAPEDLLVPEVNRAGQRLDLGSEVVHVVLAHHRVAAPVEQARHGVAGHGVSPVADVHGSSGVRRHELHVDALSLADVGSSVAVPLPFHLGEPGQPHLGAQLQVHEAGAGDVDRLDASSAIRRPDLLHETLRELSRRASGRPGQDHGGVHREVAVARIARGLDREGDLHGRPAPRRGSPGQRPADDVDDVLSHDGGTVIPAHAACSKRRRVAAQG